MLLLLPWCPCPGLPLLLCRLPLPLQSADRPRFPCAQYISNEFGTYNEEESNNGSSVQVFTPFTDEDTGWVLGIKSTRECRRCCCCCWLYCLLLPPLPPLTPLTPFLSLSRSLNLVDVFFGILGSLLTDAIGVRKTALYALRCECDCCCC